MKFFKKKCLNFLKIIFSYFSGSPDDEIELQLVYPKSATEYFYLDGKSLKLRQPIDRDPQDLAQISLEVRNNYFLN